MIYIRHRQEYNDHLIAGSISFYLLPILNKKAILKFDPILWDLERG